VNVAVAQRSSVSTIFERGRILVGWADWEWLKKSRDAAAALKACIFSIGFRIGQRPAVIVLEIFSYKS
jgi:hypothetical protein